jgi:hypothetical protein
MLYCTYMWPRGILGWGIGSCLLGLGSITSIILKLWNDRQTWLKMVLKADCLMNPLWIVWYDYMKLIDVYMWQLYVDWIVNVVGDCIYVKWWWIVVEYICTKCLVMVWWIVCVNICICSWVICSCIHDWWWRILYPIEVIMMFLLHHGWRPWRDLVPHAYMCRV